MAAQKRRSWLVIGGLHLLNGTTPRADSDPLVLVPLRAPVERYFPSNTVVLRWGDLGSVELRATTAGGGRWHTREAEGTALFPCMLPGDALLTAVAEVTGCSGSGGPLVPLFYIAPDEAAVLKEMEEAARWLESFRRSPGLNDERGVYSKRTFLQDAVTAHSELTRVVR